VVLAEREDVEPDLLGLQRDREDALIRSVSVGVRPFVGSVVMFADREDPTARWSLRLGCCACNYYMLFATPHPPFISDCRRPPAQDRHLERRSPQWRGFAISVIDLPSIGVLALGKRTDHDVA
jgi:hypothetical protein